MQITYEAPEITTHSLIVDAESLAYRAYYAFTRKEFARKNHQGYYTGCFYGFFTWLVKRYQHYQPDEMIVCWGDKKENLKRKELLASYKSSREKPPPPAFLEQIRDIQLALHLLGFKQYYSPGYEGDDTIATVALRGLRACALDTGAHKKVIIISNDKDILQLVNENLIVVQLVKGNAESDLEFTSKEVEAKFHIPPLLVADYLTLVGDSGDDVPSIPLIGPKTAIKLLTTFGAIHTWFDKIIELDISSSIKQTLLDHKRQLIINKKLVCLSLQEVPTESIEIIKDPISIEQLFEFYEIPVQPHEFLFFD